MANKGRPWMPVKVSTGPSKETGLVGRSDVRSIVAVHDGVATEEQQKAAMKAILVNICGIHDMSYRPDEAGGERDTAFAEGKRYVATQILKLYNNQSTLLKSD